MKINKTMSLSQEAVEALKLIDRPASHVVDELIIKEAQSILDINCSFGDFLNSLTDNFEVNHINDSVYHAELINDNNHRLEVIFEDGKILKTITNSDYASELFKEHFPTLL